MDVAERRDAPRDGPAHGDVADGELRVRVPAAERRRLALVGGPGADTVPRPDRDDHVLAVDVRVTEDGDVRVAGAVGCRGQNGRTERSGSAPPQATGYASVTMTLRRPRYESVHETKPVFGTPRTVKAFAIRPGSRMIGWPRFGPPGSTWFRTPIGSETATGLSFS